MHEKVILSHFLASETGITVSRVLSLDDTADGLIVSVSWKGMEASEDTLDPLEQVYEDVPNILGKLLKRKNTTPDLSV